MISLRVMAAVVVTAAVAAMAAAVAVAALVGVAVTALHASSLFPIQWRLVTARRTPLRLMLAVLQ